MHTGYQINSRAAVMKIRMKTGSKNIKRNKSKGMVSRWASKAKITNWDLRELEEVLPKRTLLVSLGVSVRTYGIGKKVGVHGSARKASPCDFK